MDKLPLFSEFKNFGTSAIKDFKTALIGRDWTWLIGYLALITLLVCVGIAGAFSIIAGGIDKYREMFPPPKASFAPKQLAYNTLIKNQKNADGLYRNLFELFITNPAGNTNLYSVTENNFHQDVECVYGSETGKADIGAGVATTTVRTLADCLSKEPVIDTGRLFSVADVQELPKECALPPPSK